MTKPSCISSSSSSTTNETLNQFDSRPKATPKHSSTSVYHFPQIPTSDHNLFTPPHHQHFPYPYFLPPGNNNLLIKTIFFNQYILDSPPSSTRTLSTSSCSSITGNPFYNTMPSGQQHCLEKDSRR